MSDWLLPVRRALDERERPIDVFFRDDDAGWNDPALDRLLTLFERLALPIDLAIIPVSVRLSDGLTDALLARRLRFPSRLGLHQHGWAHVNHEPIGRKCEFGPSRPIEAVQQDLAMGRQVLLGRFGEALDPVFTPPWNRCAASVGPLLRSLGVTVLSRDLTAARLDVPGLLECPTTLDWFAKRHGRRLSPEEWAGRAAAALGGSWPVGVLLHHAAMDETEFAGVGTLASLLSGHPACRRCSLLDAAEVPAMRLISSARNARHGAQSTSVVSAGTSVALP